MLNQNKIKFKILHDEYFTNMSHTIYKFKTELLRHCIQHGLKKQKNRINDIHHEVIFDELINNYFDKTDKDYLFYICKEKNSKEPRAFYIMVGVYPMINKIGLEYGKYFVMAKYICKREANIEAVKNYDYSTFVFLKFQYFLTIEEIEKRFDIFDRLQNAIK